MTYIIGLTGGIGSGKTVVSDRFAEHGVPIIDTDILARKIVETGHPALAQLQAEFGDSIINKKGQLDRSALREIAFANQQNKQRLDEITHPAIRYETQRAIAEVNSPYCLVVVPLLKPDTEFIHLMRRVLLVMAATETKINRVKQRSQLSRDEVLAIMQTQLDDQQRLAFADDVIHNDGTIEEAQQAADDLHQQYLKISAAAAQQAHR